MKTIYKYTLEFGNNHSMRLPRSAKLLTAQNQKGTLNMWCELDDKDKEVRLIEFLLVGTGHVLKEGYEYLSTVQFENGDLILHIYYKWLTS